MSLKDRFRIDELSGFGSKSIVRDDSGNIEVRRINKKEVTPPSLSDRPKPYGEEPIRSKQVSPQLKTDLINPIKAPNPNQESFSGETSTYIERPFYNEEELKKAIDLKVDELIKAKKPKRGNFVRQEKYDTDINNLRKRNSDLQEQVNLIPGLNGEIQRLQSQVSSLSSQVESAFLELETKDRTLQDLIEKYNETIGDLQTAILKGTKEAVERASVTAQVKGLVAQKETLTTQIKAQEDTIKTLQSQLNATISSFNNLLASQQQTAQAIQEQGQAVLETVQSQAERDRNAAAAERERQQAEQRRLEEEQRALQAEAERLKKNQKKKIICNELYRQGYLPELIWDADERWGDKTFATDPKLVIGYQMWAKNVVEFMRKKPQYTGIIYFLVKPWTEWMAYDLGVLPKNNLRGYLTHFIGKYVSYLVFNLNGGHRLLDLYNYKKFRESIG